MSININTYEAADAVKYIFSKCPSMNMNPDLGTTIADIVFEMEDLNYVDKVIKLFTDYGYDENKIIRIINKSYEVISEIDNLLCHCIDEETAFDIVCLPEEDIEHAFDFLFKYHITDDDMVTVLANKFDNMFARMCAICENKIDVDDIGLPNRIHIMTAYQMAKDNNDNDEVIMKTLSFIKNGMKSIDAYYESLKF